VAQRRNSIGAQRVILQCAVQPHALRQAGSDVLCRSKVMRSC
jgi:hypothetical protein